MQLYERLIRARKEKTISQAELAEKLNVSVQTVSRWETGKSIPDALQVQTLCEILSLTPNELLLEETDVQPQTELSVEETALIAIAKDAPCDKTPKKKKIPFVAKLAFGISLCAVLITLVCLFINKYFCLKEIELGETVSKKSVHCFSINYMTLIVFLIIFFVLIVVAIWFIIQLVRSKRKINKD